MRVIHAQPDNSCSFWPQIPWIHSTTLSTTQEKRPQMAHFAFPFDVHFVCFVFLSQSPVFFCFLPSISVLFLAPTDSSPLYSPPLHLKTLFHSTLASFPTVFLNILKWTEKQTDWSKLTGKKTIGKATRPLRKHHFLARRQDLLGTGEASPR